MSGARVAVAVVVGLLCCPSARGGPARKRGPLCALVTATPLGSFQCGPSTTCHWGVEMGVQGRVLATHGARFTRVGHEPNGYAWEGLIEQCAPTAALHGVHFDAEAGALHAWVETDADKDRYVAALCHALDDQRWLDACFAKLDLDKLDD